jgi:hypothetical protein
MNQAPYSEGAAGNADRPIPFAPGASTLPDALTPDAVGAEPFLLVVNASDDPDWSADAAIAIAAGWATNGRRVVLADLHLEQPFLHDRLGEPNLDGTVDIFLYGASVSRSARPPHDQDFFLIPAGTYTAAPEDVYAHPRWKKLVSGFREAGAILMAFVPPSAEAIRTLARWGATAVVLGDGLDDDPGALDALNVRARLVPPIAADSADEALEPGAGAVAASAWPDETGRGDTPAVEEPGSEGDAGLAEPDASWDPAVADPADQDGAEPEFAGGYGSRPDDGWTEGPFGPPRSATEEEPELVPIAGDLPAETDQRPVEPPPAGSDADFAGVLAAAEGREPHGAAAEGSATEPPPPDRAAGSGSPVVGSGRRRRRGGPGLLVWFLVAVAVVALAIIALAIARPEIFRGLGMSPGGQEIALVEAIPEPPPAPVPAGDTLPFSVQVRAYAALPPAQNQAERQARRLPETPFFVVPEMTQGVLYYKVMAGMLRDTADATALRRRLVEAGVVQAQDARDDAPGSWSLIQSRPLTYHLGEYSERHEATARADSLTSAGIPSYTINFPYSDGTSRYRVYAGAYPDTAQAAELGEMLRAAQLPARLVLRVGQGPAAMQ